MTKIELGELIRPAKVERAGASSYPLLSMTMHYGLVDQSTKFRKRIASEDLSSYKVVRRGQLVVGFPIDEGVLDFQLLYPAGVVSPAYGIWDLIDTGRVDRVYLKRFLRSAQAMLYYKTKLRGSTARRRSLPADTFLALPVPLPSLDKQRRIAAMLNHVDALRARRRRADILLEALPQALYSEMFGDPDLADLQARFGDIATLRGGRNLVAEDMTSDSPFRVLKISAVTSGSFKPGESKPLPAEYRPPVEHLVRAGDLLMSRANTAELVGAVAYVEDTPRNIALPDKIWRFEWVNPESVGIFYWSLFRMPSVRRRISRMASGTGGSMKNVSKANLQDLMIPSVGVEQQRAFAERVQAIPLSTAARYDELFVSLQTRAFNGML